MGSRAVQGDACSKSEAGGPNQADAADRWLARVLSGDMHSGERAAFEVWLAESGAAEAFLRIAALWRRTAVLRDLYETEGHPVERARILADALAEDA